MTIICMAMYWWRCMSLMAICYFLKIVDGDTLFGLMALALHSVFWWLWLCGSGSMQCILMALALHSSVFWWLWLYTAYFDGSGSVIVNCLYYYLCGDTLFLCIVDGDEDDVVPVVWERIAWCCKKKGEWKWLLVAAYKHSTIPRIIL